MCSSDLINDFMSMLVRQHGFKPISFDAGAIEVLKAYPWPGNVRELKNFVERMFIMYAGETVSSDRLPPEFHAAAATKPAARPAPTEAGDAPLDTLIANGPADLKQARASFEARFLEARLRECDGNISQLAKAVGLERSSLYRKLKAYKIKTD